MGGNFIIKRTLMNGSFNGLIRISILGITHLFPQVNSTSSTKEEAEVDEEIMNL